MIQVEQTLRLLTQHQIEFVIVGGVAISAHGSSYLTFDLDVCYARTRDNPKRLAAALAPCHPRLLALPELEALREIAGSMSDG